MIHIINSINVGIQERESEINECDMKQSNRWVFDMRWEIEEVKKKEEKKEGKKGKERKRIEEKKKEKRKTNLCGVFESIDISLKFLHLDSNVIGIEMYGGELK